MTPEGTDNMNGAKLIYQKPKNSEELRSCALFQRKLFEVLINKYDLMWDEILFPCADSRSVVVAQKLDELSVFGTHAIISGIDENDLSSAAKAAAGLTGCKLAYSIKKISGDPDSIKKALRAPLNDFEGMLICGDFSELVSGCDENWKIRDQARKFLSFTETANDKTDKSFSGLIGGKAVFCGNEENIEKISKIYEAKTGVQAKAKIHKAVRRSAK